MNDNDEWESLAGNEGRRILFSYRLTLVIYIADYSRADALNCAALQKF